MKGQVFTVSRAEPEIPCEFLVDILNNCHILNFLPQDLLIATGFCLP
jgi:hypothetical protein